MEIKKTRERLGTGYNSLLSLRASSPGRSSGEREKERELATTCLEVPWAPRRLSCQISANQGEAETSASVNKHWKARAKGNDVITNVISANRHFASTFSMQIFKFQRRSCKVSFLFPPRRQSAPESSLSGDSLLWGFNMYSGKGSMFSYLTQIKLWFVSCTLENDFDFTGGSLLGMASIRIAWHFNLEFCVFQKKGNSSMYQSHILREIGNVRLLYDN